MATATLIPVSEYLNSSYRPDCDYIDGKLQERNVGERPHGLMQGIFYAIFNANRRAWGIVVVPELRVQVTPTRFRVPDVTVVRSSDPPDDIVQIAPLICVEVLSPRDTVLSLQDRIEDYRNMGVENIWIIDPISRHTYVAASGGLMPPLNDELTIPGTPIKISLAEVFAELDDMQTPR